MQPTEKFQRSESDKELIKTLLDKIKFLEDRLEHYEKDAHDTYGKVQNAYKRSFKKHQKGKRFPAKIVFLRFWPGRLISFD